MRNIDKIVLAILSGSVATLGGISVANHTGSAIDGSAAGLAITLVHYWVMALRGRS